MKKLMKGLGILILSMMIIAGVAGWIISEPLPQGTEGTEAEALARKMLDATGQIAWDSTSYISWNFSDRHQYIWCRDKHLVQVEWQASRVLLNTENQTGNAWENGQLLEGEEARKKLVAAWAYFCNDSFWLNAPGKIYDPGTTRKLVRMDDGTNGLLVTYSSGGVTPGDSYLWILDENGLPLKWKMWVGIIPIGGLEASWENWQSLPTGGKVATWHKIGFYKLVIKDIQTGNDWESLGLTADPFFAMN